MCGIFCSLYPNDCNCMTNNAEIKCEHKQHWGNCEDVIKARGPDSLICRSEILSSLWSGNFCASVLWMQGKEVISQPIVDDNGNMLLWNGDIFSGSLFKEDSCDTKLLLCALKSSSDIVHTLREIEGPFSFVYFQKSTNQLYFGRDRFGRHSLLFKWNQYQKSMLLTSVSVKAITDIAELPAVGIFKMDLNSSEIDISCIPWYEPNIQLLTIIREFSDSFTINVDTTVSKYFPALIPLYNEFNVETSLSKCIENITFESFDDAMSILLKNKCVEQKVENLAKLLNESVRKRVITMPNLCRNCSQSYVKAENNSCFHVKVGLLFSGGLDSAILAAIADKYVAKSETIDLINVAFEKKNNSNYEVPDRLTGRQTFQELQRINPERKFNFIQVNVSCEELEKYRATRISNLMHPLSTILDESLACAVWFASRGKGELYPSSTTYTSSCRVLLLGMGADELFGGYMRHRTILKRKGWPALVDELNLEFSRISQRNLGRDDRVVADHGRQSRLPYLDEDFVKYVQSLMPWERCCPTEKLPPGLGDKLLLRLLARKIGLIKAANIPKRAFQFGSRIANGKENAKDVSTRL